MGMKSRRPPARARPAAADGAPPVPDLFLASAQILLHNALVKGRRDGLRIVRGGCAFCQGGKDGTLCVACAPLITRDGFDSLTTTREDFLAGVLGVPSEWVVDLITGFDGDGAAQSYAPAFKLGRKLARKHVRTA